MYFWWSWTSWGLICARMGTIPPSCVGIPPNLDFISANFASYSANTRMDSAKPYI